MKNIARLRLGGIFLAVALIGWVSFSSTPMEGQTTGNNAVYDSGGNCSPCKGSPAFVDASPLGSNTTDICTVLKAILTVSNGYLTSNGAVIDARGLPFTTSPTSMTCPTGQPSPWYGITSPPPSTILLPAGTIVIPATWTLPSNTHLVGEGDNPAAGGTTLQATSALANSSGPIIQFGTTSCSSSSVSTGISVDHMILDGLGGSTNGIVNSCAADDSYVDHVSLYRIRGTGLLVESNATNSGPYSNISFDTSSAYQGTSSTPTFVLC